MEDNIKRVFEFSTSIEALKKLERFRGQFYWRDYPELARYESVADHSWRLSVLVLLMSEHLSRPLDLSKALKMALIHDLPEIIAGDASPLGEDGTGKNSHAYSKDARVVRHLSEKEAAEEIFSTLPESQGSELLTLWHECEAQTSFEAQVVKGLDKIEAMLQVLEYRQGHMFPQHLEFTTAYGMKNADADPAIYELGEYVANKIRTKYREFAGVQE